MQRQPNSSLARSRTLQSFKYSWMLDLLIEGLCGGGMPE